MESQRKLILKNQETSDGNLGEIHSLCEGIYERTANADNVAEWQKKAHEADIKIHTQERQIQGLQDELNQMSIRSNEQCKESEELRKELTGLRNAAANEQAANQKIHGLTEQIERLQGMLNEKDATINRANENLEAAQEKLRLQACIVQDREEQIQNDHEQHEKALELNIQQHKQAVIQAVEKETQELRAQNQTTEKRLQEADMARAHLERELTSVRQEAEVSSKRNVEDLHQFQGEIAAVIVSLTELTSKLEESESERQGVQGSLEDWSRQRADIDQIQHMLGRLARDQPNAVQMGDRLKEALEIQKKIAGILEHHQQVPISPGANVVPRQERQHGEMSTQPEHDTGLMSNKQNVAANSQEKLQYLKRKVMVQSPVNGDDHAPPLSVEEERSTRRQLAPPRGIMKTGPQSTPRESEAHGNTTNVEAQTPIAPQAAAKRRIAKRGPKPTLTTSYSMYNRPVAGSLLETSPEQINSGQAGSYEHRSDATVDGATSHPGDSDGAVNSIYDIVETDNEDEPPMKRQRTLEATLQQGQELDGTQKIKLPRSMSASFPNQKPQNAESSDERPSGSTTLPLRGGPIERKPARMLTYSSQSAVVKRSHSQPFIASNAEILVGTQSIVASSQ
ncbi:hypothetical protein F5Y05DRAFT_402473 [Hypoxylon sp. FL0543]|nr:hypothetical protein F5Y05DRAFT_402473 [Hypoxylon sp. FL0543]